jgi:hypothetical protein
MRIDTAKIENYETMSAEDKLKALEEYEFETPTPKENDEVTKLKAALSKANSDAYDSIMSCNLAATYGGTGELCVVMGGCEAQPNAYFWSGNNGLVMDPTYFPMEQCNLAGDADAPITAFGRQQNE